MMRTWTITIHHGTNVFHSGVGEVKLTMRIKTQALTDDEAVIVAVLRSAADRARMNTRITSIEVG